MVLDYWNGTSWNTVLSSGGSLPIKDTADNLDGTLSGGRFAVVFDSTSTPLLTGLTGTVFALAPVVVAPTPPRLNILPVQSDGAFRLEFTNTPARRLQCLLYHQPVSALQQLDHSQHHHRKSPRLFPLHGFAGDEWWTKILPHPLTVSRALKTQSQCPIACAQYDLAVWRERSFSNT